MGASGRSYFFGGCMRMDASSSSSGAINFDTSTSTGDGGGVARARPSLPARWRKRAQPQRRVTLTLILILIIVVDLFVLFIPFMDPLCDLRDVIGAVVHPLPPFSLVQHVLVFRRLFGRSCAVLPDLSPSSLASSPCWCRRAQLALRNLEDTAAFLSEPPAERDSPQPQLQRGTTYLPFVACCMRLHPAKQWC
ncbi:hypothetical protein CVT26_012777 [Gymnopilus dilepis]|uniref:Uncharacterized protein n=1 Tax=Gymnopilus dilepis TaxID=231916 RepID=A0A409Y3Z9_9AGAR|nr:hypothetical protein CVT26_012777 [Gymnopilus dilepis]